MATLPGMAGRSVTISSIGKTFSVTGWKVGWAIAAPELIQAIFRVHQFMTYCGAAPLQEGATTALRIADDFYAELAVMYRQNRDFLLEALREAGLNPITPHGTYFVMVDIGDLGFPDDVAFCRHLTTKIGVAAIPPSSFYQNPADGATLARFAFCKTRETLEAAASRLKTLQQTL
jgi:N-succinyldiaminopimelate aminotransferase